MQERDRATDGDKGEQFGAWAATHAVFPDFVFLNPTYVDKKGRTKELCDLYIQFGNCALVVQIKSASAESKRSYDIGRAARWANKKIDQATSQVWGAIRTIKTGTDIFCKHPQRGLVRELGLPCVKKIFGAIIVDHPGFTMSGQIPEATIRGEAVSATILSPSEWKRLCEELRSPRDLFDYFELRHRTRNNIEFIDNSELDFLYLFLCKYTELEQAIDSDSNVTIHVEPGVWEEFSSGDLWAWKESHLGRV